MADRDRERDRNPSPFAHALRRSRSFLSNINMTPMKVPKPRSSGPSSDRNSNSNTESNTTNADVDAKVGLAADKSPNYKRRMRLVSGDERADNPLNLGEEGWGGNSWGRVREERRQRGELEGLWREMGGLSVRGVASGSASYTSRAPGDQTRGGREFKGSEQFQDSPTRNSNGGRVSSGSAAQYARSLPFRRPTQGNLPAEEMSRSPWTPESQLPLQTHRTRTRTSGPYLNPESAAQMEARLANTSSRSRPQPRNEDPPHKRVPVPRTNEGSRNPGPGPRLGNIPRTAPNPTPRSFADTQREEYLAGLARRHPGNGQERRSGGSDGKGSRAGDGTRRGVGGTLF